jgi:ubiquinone biosynthesis protein
VAERVSFALGPLRRRTPREFRALLERLGPTFVKLGQFLALRPDIIRQDYCDELLRLTDDVAPVPWDAAAAVIERELGEPPETAFAFIGRQPLAAGSLAQVHLARLHDGAEVAVKVQRPGLEAAVDRDLRRISTFAKLLEMSSAQLVLSPREVVAELAEWLRQELDFRRELSNMRRLRALTADSATQRVPRPYPEYSTAKVLTAEHLRGVPVSYVLREYAAGGDRAAAALPPDADAVRFAERFVIAMLTQMFRYRFFHADVHPGNLLLLPGDRVGFVDFGLCDRLDEQIRRRQLRYLAAVYSGDRGRMFQALTEILIPSEETDLDAFRRDFDAETQRIQTALDGRNGDGSADRSPFATYLIGLMRSAQRNRLRVPARVLALYRTLLTTESVASQLGLRDAVRSVGDGFFRELQRDELVEEYSDPQMLEGALLSVLALKREAPAQVNQLLTELSDGTFTLATRTSESRSAARAKNRRARLLTSAILSVGLALVLTVHLPDVAGVSLAWPLAALLVALYAWTLVQWSRL